MATSDLVKSLLDSGVHFGHQTKRWNPKMKRFIFGSRAGIYIIDLQKTERQLKTACAFLADLGAAGKTVLFIGTKKQAKAIVQELAGRCGMPYVSDRWMGGTLTNFQTMKRNIDLLLQLRQQKAEGYFERLSKKDAKHLQRQMDKLTINFGGLTSLSQPPAALYVIDPKREQNAVHEANRLQIPIVAICDTNADPDVITYPIPGNDDALRSIRLITTQAVDAFLEGRRRAGVVTPLVTSPSAGDTPSPAGTVPARSAANGAAA